jgi:hypothetical protein
MTVTPDTDHGITNEQQEAIGAALAQYAEAAPFPANALQDMIDDLLPVLAAIRRQAAADALTEQARHFDGRARFWRDLQRSHEAKGRPESADPYRHYADQAHRTADYLRKEAKGIIAEGYEFECAATFPPATWSSPGYGCETKVPNEGHYCDACEPEDDEDAWAE